MTFSPSFLKQINPSLHSLDKINRIETFLQKAGLDIYSLREIPGDASKRNYFRVITSDKNYILMDSSEDLGSMPEFYKIANFLVNKGLSAPEIFEIDLERGFMLLEDFGVDSLNSYTAENPISEIDLYKSCVEALMHLHHAKTPNNIPIFSDELLNKGVETFLDWYAKKHIKTSEFEAAKAELLQIFTNLYPNLRKLKPVVVLRDYMADNIFYLPKRKGYKAVGIIDFQDAAIGNPAYDLVSLLEDARRDVSDYARTAAYHHYLSIMPEMNIIDFEKSYHILSAQRNLRIIGAFYRLIEFYNKPKYAKYMPRVWGHIIGNLEHPDIAEVKSWFIKYNVQLDA